MVDPVIESTAPEAGRAQGESADTPARGVRIRAHAVPAAMQVGPVAEADQLARPVAKLLTSDHDTGRDAFELGAAVFQYYVDTVKAPPKRGGAGMNGTHTTAPESCSIISRKMEAMFISGMIVGRL
jgi:hypothetical protein